MGFAAGRDVVVVESLSPLPKIYVRYFQVNTQKNQELDI
jgi:hypothetical protein